MDREHVKSELESLFNLPANTLTEDQLLQDIAAWDSVTMLGVISLADEINGRDLVPADFNNIHTVSDIITLILGR